MVAIQHARVVRHAILGRVQGGGARGDVRRRDNVEVVLVCHERCASSYQPREADRSGRGLRSGASSKELSSGCVISGKYGPNENSVMTCDKFMTASSSVNRNGRGPARHTFVVNMFPRRIAVPDGRDVKISWGT